MLFMKKPGKQAFKAYGVKQFIKFKLFQLMFPLYAVVMMQSMVWNY